MLNIIRTKQTRSLSLSVADKQATSSALQTASKHIFLSETIRKKKMESTIALNGFSTSSLSMPRSLSHDTNFLTGSPIMSTKRMHGLYGCRGANIGGSRKQRGCILVVEAKGKKGMPGRMFNKPRPPPSIPKAEDDNPRFLLFIRTKKVPRWYPLSIITGGTTAKIMVAAKNTPIGKNLYESTMIRNIAGVVYKDEEEIRKIAFKQFPLLKAASEFQYGYQLIDETNPSSALYAKDVVKIPPQEELKPMVEKLKDFFGNALSGVKESFGSISSLNMGSEEEVTSSEKDKKSEARTTS